MGNSLKKMIPTYIKSFLTSFFYGWHGDYNSWQEAEQKCTGYNSSEIIEKVKTSSLCVKEGNAVYERDSVLFDKTEYNYPLLSALLWLASQKEDKLCVLDFGGSLGSTYYQNKVFLDQLKEVNWCIVEQPEFVKTGLDHFTDERLHFFYSIEECLNSFEIDVILLSSVLQYLEKPYDILDILISTGIDFIIIDRTPFIKGKDRLTLQKVNPKIYKATYPCWLFNEEKFRDIMSKNYNSIYEFSALDKANINSEFKGFLFRHKEKE